MPKENFSMDIPVLIAAIILTFIAAVEVVLLLHCPKIKEVPLTLLINASSPDLEEKLRYAAFLMQSDKCSIGKIIIISNSDTPLSNALCARFAEEFNECTIFISEKDENFLQKIIDFTAEI